MGFLNNLESKSQQMGQQLNTHERERDTDREEFDQRAPPGRAAVLQLGSSGTVTDGYRHPRLTFGPNA